MADETQSTQQSGNTSSGDDYKAKYEQALVDKQAAEKLVADKDRQYLSAQGNLTQAVNDRKKLEADLEALSVNSEKTKGEILAEKQTLEDAIKAKQSSETELQKQLSSKDAELEVMKLIVTDYPELAEWYGKGRIRTDLSGDALKSHLDGWKADIAAGQLVSKRRDGVSPNPERTGGQNAMTFNEVQDAKIDAMKLHGVRSKEYKELLAVEEQLFKEGKYK